MIKIPKKGASSNKPQTPGFPTEQGTPGHVGAPQSPPAPKPFIDKISLVITPKDDADAHEIHEGIGSQFADKTVFQTATKATLLGFNEVKLISLSSTNARPILHYKHDSGLAKKLRLEFNPRKIGHQGLLELHAVLTSIMDGGWSYAIQFGRISRIDVAVDLPDLRMTDFLFLPKQGASEIRWLRDGTLESFRLGSKAGNQTLVYSVKAKRLGQKKAWSGSSVVRVECRLRNPQPHKISTLDILKNPFTATLITPQAPPPAKGKSWIWELFRDAAMLRGLPAALAILPEDQRTIYRSHLKAHTHKKWHPSEFWTSWPDAAKALLI